MAKRPDATKLAAEARARAKNKLGGAARRETTSTAIHIPRDVHDLLRAVAYTRAQLEGGRASVSKLITELVEMHRADLEAEVTGKTLYPRK